MVLFCTVSPSPEKLRIRLSYVRGATCQDSIRGCDQQLHREPGVDRVGITCLLPRSGFGGARSHP